MIHVRSFNNAVALSQKPIIRGYNRNNTLLCQLSLPISFSNGWHPISNGSDSGLAEAGIQNEWVNTTNIKKCMKNSYLLQLRMIISDHFSLQVCYKWWENTQCLKGMHSSRNVILCISNLGQEITHMMVRSKYYWEERGKFQCNLHPEIKKQP